MRCVDARHLHKTLSLTLSQGTGRGNRKRRKETQPEVRVMAKQVFQRTKPNVNVGTIGHIDHGKTTLTAALSARSARLFPGSVTPKDYATIAKGGVRRDASKVVTVVTAHVEYE